MIKSGETNNGRVIDQLNEDIFLALFRKGAYEYLEEQADKDLDHSETLSESCEQRIMRLIKKENRREQAHRALKTLTKVAVILLIILAVSTITILSVEAFRVPVFNLFIQSSDEFTDISVGEDAPPAAAQEYFTQSIYIPAGYELTATDELVNTIKYFYSDADGGSITISRYGMGSHIGFNTEDAETSTIDINGQECLYSIRDGWVSLFFKTDEYAYLIDGSVELSEVVKIAESIL